PGVGRRPRLPRAEPPRPARPPARARQPRGAQRDGNDLLRRRPRQPARDAGGGSRQRAGARGVDADADTRRSGAGPRRGGDGASTVELSAVSRAGSVLRLGGGRSSITLAAPPNDLPSLGAYDADEVLFQAPSHVARFLPPDSWR